MRRLWRIPVCYGGEHGPDLAGVADAIGLSEAAAVEAHTSEPLDVFMMGFLPGTYLGVLENVFDIPRLVEPRVKVPARSVSVAQRQTTIYTIESPGGGTSWATPGNMIRTGTIRSSSMPGIRCCFKPWM